MTVGATLEFHGAAGEVTGSCTLLVTPKARILVDFGMFMGTPADEARNAVAPAIDFASLDAVICTHAHIDHSGALPLLVKQGYRGPIYATHATRDLCAAMLRDAAYIQESDARYLNRQIARGEIVSDPIEPLYTEADALEAIVDDDLWPLPTYQDMLFMR